MGNLMRRYWHPIATVSQLRDEPVLKVRLLGEDLVLYQDRSGQLGLIQQACPHRRISLEYGIPEEHGLRCPYHGWLFEETGRCLETPAEAPDSTFKDRIRADAYRVEALGGLVFAYMGPEPAPLLPRWEWLVDEPAYRQVNFIELPCNWLQCMENSLDPTHTEWLHGHFANYAYERKGAAREQLRTIPHHSRIGFDVFEYGIIKRRVQGDETEEDADWRIGHPVLFPNILSTPNQFRVPMDDTHTLHVDYVVTKVPPGVPVPALKDLPYYYPPLLDERGKHITDYTFGQDYMAWVTQGPLAERHKEKLAESDKGIILYRRLLREQMDRVAQGLEPTINFFRDPEQNVRIELPHESKGVAIGLKSTRLTQGTATSGAGIGPAWQPAEMAMRRALAPLPPWLNTEPWAGAGLRHWLGAHDYPLPEPSETRGGGHGAAGR